MSAARISFRVRLTPRGGRDEVGGVGSDGELLVRVRAAPVDGAANDALMKLLADELRIPRTSIALVRGASSRLKLVALNASAEAALKARWPLLLTSPA